MVRGGGSQKIEQLHDPSVCGFQCGPAIQKQLNEKKNSSEILKTEARQCSEIERHLFHRVQENH